MSFCAFEERYIWPVTQSFSSRAPRSPTQPPQSPLKWHGQAAELGARRGRPAPTGASSRRWPGWLSNGSTSWPQGSTTASESTEVPNWHFLGDHLPHWCLTPICSWVGNNPVLLGIRTVRFQLLLHILKYHFTKSFDLWAQMSKWIRPDVPPPANHTK